MTNYTSDEVNAYAKSKRLTPGTLLWATDVPLSEEAFRSGGKNAPGVDFLRWQDIGLEETKGRGRIPQEEWGNFVVGPGDGISLFIKRMIPQSTVYLGDGIEKTKIKDLKNDFNPIDERFWWQIESGQPLPTGLQLIYDGVPPGHCTLTVTREMPVNAFMQLVLTLKFISAGTSYYGKKI
ncbi:hypothetical protein V8J88_01090 [Massilia sp. W12]|uniref:hypothetical protein n=1 Tax=Massilia sp. W12 TaxID=3126507 RepID=UPI0030D3CB4E